MGSPQLKMQDAITGYVNNNDNSGITRLASKLSNTQKYENGY